MRWMQQPRAGSTQPYGEWMLSKTASRGGRHAIIMCVHIGTLLLTASLLYLKFPFTLYYFSNYWTIRAPGGCPCPATGARTGSPTPSSSARPSPSASPPATAAPPPPGTPRRRAGASDRPSRARTSGSDPTVTFPSSSPATVGGMGGRFIVLYINEYYYYILVGE